MTRQQAINYLSNSGFSMIQVETIVRALSTLSEVDFKELKDRYGDEVEYVVRDMVSGENLRWVELPRPKKQEPTTKNDLGVDCISRKAVLDELGKWDWQELYLPIHFKENIVDVLPSVTPQEPRWIPVSKLPKAGEYIGDVARYYLVQNEYGDMMVASYDGIGWQQMYQHGYVEDKVVAWMPLPQKYREVEK